MAARSEGNGCRTGRFLKVEADSQPAAVTDANWERRAQKLATERLTTLRGQGEKWAATVGSLTGILGIVGLVKGPEDITALAEGWRIATIACIGVALCAGVGALLWASSAAQGWPRDTRFTGEEIRRLETSDARRARAQLWWSKAVTLLAVAALILSVLITWLKTPPKASATAKVLVVRNAGPPVCGELQASAAAESGIRLHSSRGVMVVPAAEVRALGPVSACDSD